MRSSLGRPKCHLRMRKLMMVQLLVLVGLLMRLTLLFHRRHERSTLELTANSHRVVRRNVEAATEANKSCACELKSISSSFLRLSQLQEKDPYETGTSYEVLVRRHPNLGSILLKNKSHCSLLPFVTSLHWNGEWQVTAASESAQYKLYSAACDRNHAEGVCSAIRILAMAEAKIAVRPLCYLWPDTDSSPLVVKASQPEFLDYQGANNRLVPYLLTCPVPHTAPHIGGVSINLAPCSTVSNFLQVLPSSSIHTRSEAAVRVALPRSRQSLLDVAVCGPALFYYHDDVSSRLVEWIEILKALGFSKVFLYLTKAHPNVEKVLRFYEKQGFVKVTKFSYPSPYIDDPILRRCVMI
ncbi:Glycosyltransferase family 92 [Trinorchestia longiramus]|nr:Glycosyltransferase family 92 [Trinorchestia longiramus]